MKRSILSFLICLAFLRATAQYVAEILPTPNGGGTAAAAGGGQIVGGSFGPGAGPTLWDGPSHTLINLSPAGYDFAEVFGVGGGKQVGYGFTNNDTRAIMWTGSAASVVDLHPDGYLGSTARSTDGTNQVGDATVSINGSRAGLWQGSSQSFINLHPSAGYEWSIAYGVDGNIQVGTAQNTQVMWRGTASSMVVLPLPKGYDGGSANSVSGNQIVGSAGARAVLWDADSLEFIDLGPGFAFDTNGAVQVGYAGLPFDSRAKAWFGASGSELDLHQFLDNGFDSSQALGIDESGAIVGWGEISGIGSVPIVWTPVPEPCTLIAICIGIGILAPRKRKNC